MEYSFVTLFEDVRHDRSLILKLWKADPDNVKQGGPLDHEKIF